MGWGSGDVLGQWSAQFKVALGLCPLFKNKDSDVTAFKAGSDSVRRVTFDMG